MTGPTKVKQVLAVIPPKAGGHAASSRVATGLGSVVHVTLVETADEDKAALARAQVIITDLNR